MIRKRTMNNLYRFTPIVLTLIVCAGCQIGAADRLAECRKDIVDVKQQNAELTGQIADANQTIEEQNRRIETLINLPKDRFAKLVKVERIELARLTAGYDTDKDGIDDGIVVHIKPIDADGHVVKSAGRIDVKTFDLAGEAPKLLGSIMIPAEESSAHWYGKLWTHHFTVRCPFSSQPSTGDVTVRVTFVDLLTGKTLTAQKLCTVKVARQ